MSELVNFILHNAIATKPTSEPSAEHKNGENVSNTIHTCICIIKIHPARDYTIFNFTWNVNAPLTELTVKRNSK